MENWRLLMLTYLNVFVACDVPMMHSMRLLKFHPYIYQGESPKSMKFPIRAGNEQSRAELLTF